MNKLGKVAVALAAVLSVGAAGAADRIIRYVTPDGTGDGTSWENACGDLATAYGQVVDNPGGGEVWLAKGRYALDSSAASVADGRGQLSLDGTMGRSQQCLFHLAGASIWKRYGLHDASYEGFG